MNLLLIHNNYGIYSGEEAVVDKQIALFRELGCTVSEYRKTTEGVRGTLLGDIKGLLQGFYSPLSVKDIKQLMKTNKPDVVIIHNLYPYISPAVLKHIKKAGVPIIMTIHNFRLICPTGLFMREAKPCEYCLEKRNEWGCVKFNCEHSALKSLGYAGRNWFARITKAYTDNVDYYACITKFQTEKLTQFGYPKERMLVIPNFADKVKEPISYAGDYVAISGRISKEKGIDLIIELARQTPHISYRFAGGIRPEDKDLIKDAPKNCIFLGYVSGDELTRFYQNARFLLIGSRWYEGFPMTVLDASQYGKATIGPAHAGFLEIIDKDITGLLFTPSDVESMKQQVERLWNDFELAMKYGQAAFSKLINEYTLEAVKGKWDKLLKRSLQD